MLEASEAEVTASCDIFIASTAVADYRPENLADQKIKKSSEAMSLALVRNPDTLATIAARQDAPFTVGFAAETRDVEHYARDKMTRKQLDMIVANDVSVPGIGFNSDQNAVSVFWEGGRRDLGPEDKTALARDIVALIADRTAGA